MHLLLIGSECAPASKIHQLLARLETVQFQLSSFRELSELLQSQQPIRADVAFFDFASRETGLDELAQLRSHFSDLAIVVLADDGDERLAKAALAQGADDFIRKRTSSFEILLRSIQYVVERRERLRLEQELAETRMEERRRISQELHDGVLQSLNAVRMRLQMHAARVRIFDCESSRRTSQIAESTLETIHELRRVSKCLRSPVLDSLPLLDAITRDSERLARQFNVRINVRSNGIRELNGGEQHHIYRIFQESVHNAIRHAQASDIVVELAEALGVVSLRIADNGVGFDVASVELQSEGIGLSSIRERAEALGGVASIESAGDCGTSIKIDLPPRKATYEDASAVKEIESETVPQPKELPLGERDTVMFSSRDTVE